MNTPNAGAPAQLVQIPMRYIGKREIKRLADIFPGNNIVWRGKGDVQMVEASLVPRMLRHPDIWEIAKDVVPQRDTPEGDLAVAMARQDSHQGVLRAQVMREALPPAAAVASPVKSEEELMAEASAELADSQVTKDAIMKRLKQVIGAIAELRPNKDFDQQTGKPKCTALQAKLGRPISAVERDAAWNALKMASEKQARNAAQPAAHQTDEAAPSGSEDTAIPE